MQKYWQSMPYWLIVNGIKSLLGEIYPEIREIICRYIPEKKYLLIRYCLDREPLEEDYESAERFITSLLNSEAAQYIKSYKVELFHFLEYPETINPLDKAIYYRHNPSQYNDFIEG